MCSDDIALRVEGLSKHYLMFARPEDRLKQSIVPRLQRLAGRPATQYYRDFAALRDVSFQVERGETVGIIGRNGSGKSTLLQIICGTLNPTAGSVTVNGRIAALLELGAGFNPDFTGRENAYLNGAILGLSRAEIDARFDAIAAFADIGEFIEQPVKTYSSGMYVRLAFAVAINVDPDILIVDEALSVGDEAFQRKCFARIEDIRDKGGTILFVTHSGQTIVQLCDRALLFDKGELLLEGRPKTVVGQYQRLANASAEAAGDVRAQIRALGHAPAAPAEAQAPSMAAPELAAVSATATGGDVAPCLEAPQDVFRAADPPQDDGRADYFDPGLVSQSMVELEARGAKIRDVRITTLDGKTVNVLRTGKRYVFAYAVEFAVDATGVGFGFGVRTTTGVYLAGAQTIKQPWSRTKSIRRSEVYSVTIEFHCLLLPGVYFIGCGVEGNVAGDQAVMARIFDAIVFRVPDYTENITHGYFDIEPNVSVQKRLHDG